jgi:Cdc6-like AAA superfamily ATPase
VNADGFFRESPFSLTASRETSACWSGRQGTLDRLIRLQSSFEHRSDSSLDVLWANFGAGKSHALYHLMYRVEAAIVPAKPILTAYVEMPEQIRKFTELYSRIIRALPLDQIANLVAEAKPRTVPDELRRCATALLHGGAAEKDIAEQWLVAGRPGLRELKGAIGIGTRIEDDASACDILSGIVTAAAEKGSRILVLLDEFQRIALSQTKTRRDVILSSLRSVFSRNPRCFSMVVAVTSRLEQTAMEMFPRELRSLVGMRPAVSLPELSKEEAMDFVMGRFRFFRPSGYSRSASAPFGTKTLEGIIEDIAGGNSSRLIPRQLLQALAWVYDSEAGNGELIPLAKAKSLLAELRWDTAE